MEDSAADLCSRCASISWDQLEQKEVAHLWHDERPTLGDLQTSSCRLCRLIAYTILTQPVHGARPQSVVTMNWRQASELEDRYLGSLDLWAEPGGYLGSLILMTGESAREDATAVFPEVSKRVDFAMVKQFVEACKASHKSCDPETSPQLPDLRVIDCVDNTVIVAPIGCSFVALSYVWGGLSADSYVLGSRIAFPPTIEDAVRTTRELGYEYLWVDRYCINQDDPYDKEIQVSQMGQIYASAQLTIVAAAGADPSYGLVGISRDRTVLSAREPVGGSQLLCPLPDTTREYIAHSPWFSRAWTLQEGYLSKRLLCFTERETVVTCKSCFRIPESTPNPWERHFDPRREIEEAHARTALCSQAASLLDATNIMNTYSRRVRGHESDMLYAVLGILNVLKNGRSPIYHIWGVPFTITRRLDATHSADSTISICLNWCPVGSARRLPEFPSWSTLGWIGQVYHDRIPEVTPHFMIKYWSGEKYQELDNGTCDLDYTYCGDVPHRSQYLQITTDVVPVELHSWCHNDNLSYFLQPTFITQKEVRDRGEVRPNRDVQSPLLELHLDDDTALDATLPIVYATMTPPELDSDTWSSFRNKDPLLLVFQQKAKSYERIGVCRPNVYTIDKNGKYEWSSPSNWEFVPPGEPGAWDQVAERRTFLLG